VDSIKETSWGTLWFYPMLLFMAQMQKKVAAKADSKL